MSNVKMANLISKSASSWNHISYHLGSNQSGQEDNRHIRVLTYRPAQIKACSFGQEYIQNNQILFSALPQLFCLYSRSGNRQFIALFSDDKEQTVNQTQIFFYEENVLILFHHP